MAYIHLNGISKSYSDTKIIDNLNLTINEKECVVIVGPSGCGKSTLLRLLSGLDDIDRGMVMINGKAIHHLPPSRRGIAMVFQSYALYPHMTVYENMAFGLSLKKFSKQEIKDRVLKAADILQINDLLSRKPRQLSGGQRQRVAIGRAIVRKPRVLLLDEPLSNLDAKLRIQMRQEFIKLREVLNTTMIYVTHDQREAMTLADKIVVLNKGTVEQVGTPDDIFNKPVNTFVAGFLGSPRMNFLEARVYKKEDDKIIFTVGNLQKIMLPIMCDDMKVGDSINIGIRSNSFYFEDHLGPSLKGDVVAVEYYGEAKNLSVDIGQEKTITVRTKDFSVKKGDSINLYFGPEKCHYFTKMGNRLDAAPIDTVVQFPLSYANDY